jgi:AcrR family transcriptional regulator
MAEPSARRAGSEETRAALLDAAAREFLERGFHGASGRQIAERAGFTNPVLYYHFGGKDALYQELIHSAFRRLEGMLRSAIGAAREPLAQLRAIAAAYLRFGQDDPVRLRVLFAECFRPLSSTPAIEHTALREWVDRQIEAVLRQGAEAGIFPISDVAQARRLLLALLGGLLAEQASRPDVPLLEASLADQVVETFLHGIAGAGRVA